MTNEQQIQGGGGGVVVGSEQHCHRRLTQSYVLKLKPSRFIEGRLDHEQYGRPLRNIASHRSLAPLCIKLWPMSDIVSSSENELSIEETCIEVAFSPRPANGSSLNPLNS